MEMATLPESSGFYGYQAEMADYPTETFLVDPATHRMIGVQGGQEAMRQMVEITLNIERYKYQIYSSNAGVQLQELIGQRPEYITSMLKRRITDALLVDRRILSVHDFQFSIQFGQVHCSFQVLTVYGEVEGEVTI